MQSGRLETCLDKWFFTTTIDNNSLLITIQWIFYCKFCPNEQVGWAKFIHAYSNEEKHDEIKDRLFLICNKQ